MRQRVAGLNRALRLIVLFAAPMLLVSVFAMPAAYAADFSIEIPIDTVIEGNEGTTHTVATGPVGLELQGRECNVTSQALNQRSVHPGNDLLVQSGGSEVVLLDVESDPNATVVGEGTLTLGNEIVVVLRLGEDGIYSGGIAVTVDCPEPQPGRIIVAKEVTQGSSTTQEFGFSTSYGDGFSLSDGVQSDSGELDPGTYTVTENVPDGWTLESAVCDDESDPDGIDLAAGETVTCTFINDEVEVAPDVLPEIAVNKTPDVDAASPEDVVTFTFVITNPSATEPVRISSVTDSVFGALSGDADCKAEVVLAAGASCEFNFAWTVTDDDIGTHENEVVVIGVDVEKPEVTVEARAEAVVEISEVEGIVITPPEQPAAPAPVTPVEDSPDVPGAQVEAEQLPFTGIETDWLIGLGILLLGGGALLLRLAPGRHET